MEKRVRALKRVILPESKRQSRTRHLRGAEQVEGFCELRISQYENDQGFYLFYYDEFGEELSDTYHDYIELAMRQAEFEFSVSPPDWSNITPE